MRSSFLFLSLTLTLTACGHEATGDVPSKTDNTYAGENWPGGSLGGWADKEGVRVAWDGRRTSNPSTGEPGGHFGGGYAADAGAAPAEDWDEGESGAGGAPGHVGSTMGGEEVEDHADSPVRGNDATPLEGGEIDDNEHYDTFLEYALEALEDIGDDPSVHWLDVTERHYVSVVDSQGRHVPDATVVITTDGDDIIGRTRADGQFAFFPGAYGAVNTGDILAWTPQGSGEAQIEGERTEVVLDAVREDADVVDVDVAFVIDATGSMSEEIQRIKTTITDIAAQISDTPGVGTLRFGLVDYRDRGDAYITHSVDFTDDIQAFQGVIEQVEAGGGGDFPEDLNAALRDTMRRLDWQRSNTLRLAFVVADAPAHHYQEEQEYRYDQAMIDAAAMGVKIFPIASGGSNPVAEFQFRQLAQFSQGHFIFITEGGGSTHGSGGSEYEVDENQFQVERLDALLVRLVTEEIEAWLAGAVQFL